jgi:2,3-bisphosphoglycerate-independent phosphoglycerate mutase
MLFLDGVGLGREEPSVNPFFAAELHSLKSLLGGVLPSLQNQHVGSSISTLVPLDANLGVDGLPQSGTGQTALFTGKNGAALIGKHYGPHPYSTLKPVIEEHNIFRRLITAGRRPMFANAFPARFFEHMAKPRSRLTVTTLSCVMSGMRLLDAEDLSNGRGISADITGEGWKDLGYTDIEPITPWDAGKRLARLSEEHDFVLFEYWKTDHAGHAQDMHTAINVLERFDAMLSGIVKNLDVENTLLFLTSDHGNVEDLSTRTHTRNPVPAILYGARHQEIARALEGDSSSGMDLTRVTPLLISVISDDLGIINHKR